MAREVTVRSASADDLTDVLGVLDAAALDTDPDRVRASIDRSATLVAVRANADANATVLGALVLVRPGERCETGRTTETDGKAEIDAIAVRRGRRGQGIGRALVAAAAGRYDRLVAEFDSGVRPFYASLGFAVTPVEHSDPERYRGELRRDPAIGE